VKLDRIVRSNCRGCHGGCGVLVHVDGEHIVKIEGDPECAANHGSLCAKGLAFTQLVYHPERLKHPLRRIGAPGEGRWQRISWDEALDTIADRLNQIRLALGPESIALGYGTGRNYEAYLYRFANLFGTRPTSSPLGTCAMDHASRRRR